MFERRNITAMRAMALLFVVGGVSQALSADRVQGGEAKNEVQELLARCAPTVNPETMSAVISAESKGHRFAIADAGPVKLPWSERKELVRSFYPGSVDAAVEKATELIAAGHTVSLGLSQVNDRNLARLGTTIREIFEPCANVAAGGKILTEFYQRAVSKFGPGPRALRASISAYNSGDWLRGDKDGYVGLVYNQVGRPLVIKTAAVVPSIKMLSRTKVETVAATSAPLPERKFAMSTRSFMPVANE